MAFSDPAPTDGTDGAALPAAVAVFRQALATFPPSKDFEKQFQKLKSMVDQLRAEDLGLDPIFSDSALWKKPGKAPCTYIEVFQNKEVNMGIFILAPGYKMPLHDHPQMHGLLKVLKGAVHIRSFTEHSLTDECEDGAEEAESTAARMAKDPHEREKFFAKVTAKLTCNENSPTCLLTPSESNFHEIQALEFPAAFVDILSPPYDDNECVSDRTCHYYKIVNEVSSNIVEFEEIGIPHHYYCDQAPYLGPLLF